MPRAPSRAVFAIGLLAFAACGGRVDRGVDGAGEPGASQGSDESRVWLEIRLEHSEERLEERNSISAFAIADAGARRGRGDIVRSGPCEVWSHRHDPDASEVNPFDS